MFLIPRRQIWTQQPQTEAAVAAEYLALNPKLIVNYGASPNDLVSSKFPVAVNRAYGVDAQGKGLKGSSGVAQYAARLTGKELTIVISVTPGDYAGSPQMLLETEVATAARTEGSLMLLPYYNTAGANASLWTLCIFPSDGINYTYGGVVFPAPTAGIPHTLAIRINRNLTGAAKMLSVHVDGVAQVLTPRLDGASNTQDSNSNFNTNNIYINHRAGALFPGSHNVHFVGVFGSLFSSEKAKSLSANPWQIFKRSDSRIFVPVSAGGGSAQTLTPPLHTNSQSFYSPAVSQSSAPQSLTASLFTSSSTIFVPTVQASKALSAGLFSNANTLYSPTVTATKTLGTSFYSNAQAFYAHVLNQVGGPQNVVVPLFNNTQTFYSPLLSPGAVSVAPSLYANAPTFYGLTVTTSKTLTASLFSNAGELYTPIVSIAGGPQIVAPSLFSNTASFFTHTVGTGQVQLYPVRFDSASAFYAPVVSTGSFTGSISDADITRIVQAVLAALNATTIPVDVQKMNGAVVIGTGLVGDDWRGFGVQPQ